MIWFKFHKPGFIDNVEPASEWKEYHSFAELSQTKKFLNWKRQPNFHGFETDHGHVLAVFDEGHEWYVIGAYRGELGLPRWNARYRDSKEKKGGKNELGF